jgi:hypothetical protein
MLQIGDVIRFESNDPEDEPLGVIITICDPSGTAEVLWDDGEIYIHDDCDLEVVCAA